MPPGLWRQRQRASFWNAVVCPSFAKPFLAVIMPREAGPSRRGSPASPWPECVETLVSSKREDGLPTSWYRGQCTFCTGPKAIPRGATAQGHEASEEMLTCPLHRVRWMQLL